MSATGVMYLGYGSFRSDPGECNVVISRVLKQENGIVLGYTERWDVEGRLQINSTGVQATDQAAISQAIALRQQAYAQSDQILAFYFSNGALSSHVLDPGSSAGGLRITPLNFPVGRGAEYSTFRNYSFSAEADYLDPSIGLLSWIETITTQGGGPQWGYLLTLNGPPQQQLLRQQTTFKASQQGEAIGQFGYPFYPGPIWPDAEHVDQRSVNRSLPGRTGRGRHAAYTGYKVNWSYSFESAGPLIGLPTPWPE